MAAIDPACRGAVTTVSEMVRIREGLPSESLEDQVAVEEPLEIRVNTQSVSVTMRTPGHDEELAAGFLLTEGLLHSPADIAEIGPCATARLDGTGNIINVTLADGVESDLASLTRHVFASSSCGLCGKASIANIQMRFPPVAGEDVRLPLAVLKSLPDKLRSVQKTFEQTGGLHAAGVFDLDGELVVAREDVGRHNAVDKVLGYGFLRGMLPFSKHVLLVSGRASFEILQKSLAAGFPIVAAVSAPSSLAVSFAAANHQTLAGFLRPSSVNLYTHPERISE